MPGHDNGKLNDFLHPSPDRSRRHRSRTGRAEGGQSGGADAGRPADAGRLRAHGRRLSPSDCAARRRRPGRRLQHGRPADLAQAVGADSAGALSSSRSRRKFSSRCSTPGARSARPNPARRGAILGADRGPRRREFRRSVRKLPRAVGRNRIPHRGARLLGGVVDLATRAATWKTTVCRRPTPPWAC